MKAIRDVYACRGPESSLAAQKNLEFKSGWNVELLLKVPKWFFILEDLDYWNHNRRDELTAFIEKTVGPWRTFPEEMLIVPMWQTTN